jgi:DNA-binding MarR family transcriptional regulator
MCDRNLASIRFSVVFIFILVFLAYGFIQGARAAQAEQRILDYNYLGSGPGAEEYTRVMKSPSVQSLLLHIAESPKDRAFVDEALRETGVTAFTLQEIGLIRLEGELFQLSFSLLTPEDIQKIRAVAEREGRFLAQELLAHRPVIEELIKSQALPGIDWRDTAFFILGCVSLDWDGLNLAEKKGALADPPKGTFIPTAKAPTPRETIKQLYWGSHSYHSETAVTTFGDHFTEQRLGFPDVLWSLNLEVPEPIKAKAIRAAEGLVRRHAAALMLDLREGAKNAKQLAEVTGFSRDDVKDILELLVELDYVVASDSLYRSLVPILTEKDRPMVRRLRSLGYQVMMKWYDERYTQVCEELATLTPRRFNVPLANSFYEIWHYIFGIANRELVAESVFVDPYASNRRFKGFLPTVYQLDVVQESIEKVSEK